MKTRDIRRQQHLSLPGETEVTKSDAESSIDSRYDASPTIVIASPDIIAATPDAPVKVADSSSPNTMATPNPQRFKFDGQQLQTAKPAATATVTQSQSIVTSRPITSSNPITSSVPDTSYQSKNVY